VQCATWRKTSIDPGGLAEFFRVPAINGYGVDLKHPLAPGGETTLDLEVLDAAARRFGFGSVRSIVELAAPWFVGAALGLDVLGTFYVDRTPFVVGGLRVAAGRGLDGLAMGELSERARVVAIRRADGEAEFPPRRDTTFAAGDQACLVGLYDEVVQVRQRDSAQPRAGHEQGVEMP